MRSRNIKPGFFTNEFLAECSYPARLLFAGLWLIADCDGYLEDRPKRIAGELFRYDQNVDVEPWLVELTDRHFIERYVADGKAVIHILQFSAHQNPHPKEKSFGLPQNPQSREKVGQSREKVRTSREKVDTSPDVSCIMNHDVLNLGATAAEQKHGSNEPLKVKGNSPERRSGMQAIGDVLHQPPFDKIIRNAQ